MIGAREAWSEGDAERRERASGLRLTKTRDVNCMGAEYVLSLIEMKTDFESVVRICIFRMVWRMWRGECLPISATQRRFVDIKMTGVPLSTEPIARFWLPD